MHQEQIYRRLQSYLLSGKVPPGTHLAIDMLADELRVSSTPIREALCRLQQDRLVDLVPSRGFFQISVSPRDLASYFEALKFFLETSSIKGMCDSLGGRQKWIPINDSEYTRNERIKFAVEFETVYLTEVCNRHTESLIEFAVNILRRTRSQRLSLIDYGGKEIFSDLTCLLDTISAENSAPSDEVAIVLKCEIERYFKILIGDDDLSPRLGRKGNYTKSGAAGMVNRHAECADESCGTFKD